MISYKQWKSTKKRLLSKPSKKLVAEAFSEDRKCA